MARNELTRSRIASAPSRSVRRVEPTMSPNSTVTCFISPGSALPGTATCTAPGFATKGSGAIPSRRPGRFNGAPHWPQNRCSGGLLEPQDGHSTPKVAPHCPQNFIPAGFSAVHRGHLMPSLRGAPRSGCRWGQPSVLSVVRSTFDQGGEPREIWDSTPNRPQNRPILYAETFNAKAEQYDRLLTSITG